MRQPNLGGARLRLTDLPRRFWALLVLTGVGAGLAGIVMMGVLRLVQHGALDYRSGTYSDAAARSGDVRLVSVLALGGLVTGVGLWLMHRSGGAGDEPIETVWSRSGRLSLPRTAIAGALSEVTVGLGGSLGREAAPQHTGAAAGAFLGSRFGMTAEQTTLLISCGAGAGLAAVYDVPLAGTLFAIEIYLGSISLPIVLPALLSSAIATAVAWLALPSQPLYNIGQLPSPTLSLLAFALLIGPLIGLVSAGFVRMVGWASAHRPSGASLAVWPLVVFTALGLLALEFPLLLGNGHDLAQFAFTSGAGLGLLAVLAALKAVATTACLRSGAAGGLLTPTMSVGAAAGGALGQVWLLLWPGTTGSASYGVIGMAAMLAAAMQAPATGMVLVLELTRSVDAIMVPMLLAVASATLTMRALESRSIYSARLAPVHDAPRS